MITTKNTKLSLRAHSIRNLSAAELRVANGGVRRPFSCATSGTSSPGSTSACCGYSG